MRRAPLTIAVVLAGLSVACGEAEPVEPPPNPRDSAVQDSQPPVPVDEDGDGWAVDGGDCDDGDPAVNPYQDEVCDGIDNDCDGYVDLGAVDATRWFLDADADGYGCPTCITSACEQPTGRVEDNTDCDDEDPAVNPGAAEVPDGIDNDCDGEIDE